MSTKKKRSVFDDTPPDTKSLLPEKKKTKVFDCSPPNDLVTKRGRKPKISVFHVSPKEKTSTEQKKEKYGVLTFPEVAKTNKNNTDFQVSFFFFIILFNLKKLFQLFNGKKANKLGFRSRRNRIRNCSGT